VVSFEEEREVRGRERRFDEKESVGQGENRRKERRRTEAKAAIEVCPFLVIDGDGMGADFLCSWAMSSMARGLTWMTKTMKTSKLLPIKSWAVGWA
jgi:hypothetical protein